MTETEKLILDVIDEDTGYSIAEFSEKTGASKDDVQRSLESLMEQGLITSTPDWKYRLSRRNNH